jgi:hypothetical protein
MSMHATLWTSAIIAFGSDTTSRMANNTTVLHEEGSVVRAAHEI